jgi:transcriptional regulator with XRE-family HTH domain
MKLRILEICKQKGFTQKELAEKVSLSPVGLSKAINGNPTKSTLERIAVVLNVPITELFEQPATDVIICPYCGNKIKVSKE